MSQYTAPVAVRPVYMPKIWGGTLIARNMQRDLPGADIGEAWDVSAIPGAQSTVITPGGDVPLGAYAANPAFYGSTPYDSFPLLIKIIGAEDRLSVQVHPSDLNCAADEAGKAEAWVILAAKPGAKLVYGLNCPREDFARAVERNDIDSCLNYVDVSPGDVFNIRPGQVHAIGAGITLYEVQQTSDTTYRLYDYGRLDGEGNPRELHVRRALGVTDDTLGKTPCRGVEVKEEGCVRTMLLLSRYFALERLAVDGGFTDAHFNSYAIYTAIDGGGEAGGAGGSIAVKKGDVFIMPAQAGALRFEGRATLLKAHLPKRDAYEAWLAQKGACLGREDHIIAKEGE